MILDAPPSVPASTGGLLTAQTASRVARSVTNPELPAGHLRRALSDALTPAANIVLHRSFRGTDFIFSSHNKNANQSLQRRQMGDAGNCGG